jgi:hypothetical protein
MRALTSWTPTRIHSQYPRLTKRLMEYHMHWHLHYQSQLDHSIGKGQQQLNLRRAYRLHRSSVQLHDRDMKENEMILAMSESERQECDRKFHETESQRRDLKDDNGSASRAPQPAEYGGYGSAAVNDSFAMVITLTQQQYLFPICDFVW